MTLSQPFHSVQVRQLSSGGMIIQLFQGAFDLFHFYIASIAGAMRSGFPRTRSGGRSPLPQPVMGFGLGPVPRIFIPESYDRYIRNGRYNRSQNTSPCWGRHSSPFKAISRLLRKARVLSLEQFRGFLI